MNGLTIAGSGPREPALFAFYASGAGPLLQRSLLIYGLGGLVVPFPGIKLIDIIVNALHLV